MLPTGQNGSPTRCQGFLQASGGAGHEGHRAAKGDPENPSVKRCVAPEMSDAAVGADERFVQHILGIA